MNNVGEQLSKLKRQPGKDIAILGSSELTVSLLKIGLVDEVRLMVNPVVLGAGKSVFSTDGERISLKLLKSRPFDFQKPCLSGHAELPAMRLSFRQLSWNHVNRTAATSLT